MRSKPVILVALLLACGSLSDRLGRKGMLLAGLAVVGAASLAGGFTTSAAQLIAARAVMGLGAAMTFPATLSLIANVFTQRTERARAIGLWGAVAGVAIATGPIVGGWLLERYSWAAIFIAMAPVAAAAVVLVAVAVPTSRDPGTPAVDGPGLVLSSAAMALLVFTIIEAPAYGWTAARSVVGFAISAAKAGIGSAVNDSTRLIGGTLGVAVIGTNAFLRGLAIGALVAGGVAAWGSSWPYCSCPLSQRPQRPTKPKRPSRRTIARPIPALHNSPPARLPQPSTSPGRDGQPARGGNHPQKGKP